MKQFQLISSVQKLSENRQTPNETEGIADCIGQTARITAKRFEKICVIIERSSHANIDIDRSDCGIGNDDEITICIAPSKIHSQEEQIKLANDITNATIKLLDIAENAAEIFRCGITAETIEIEASASIGKRISMKDNNTLILQKGICNIEISGAGTQGISLRDGIILIDHNNAEISIRIMIKNGIPTIAISLADIKSGSPSIEIAHEGIAKKENIIDISNAINSIKP